MLQTDFCLLDSCKESADLSLGLMGVEQEQHIFIGFLLIAFALDRTLSVYPFMHGKELSSHSPPLGNEKSARSFSDRSFFMDVRTGGSAPKCFIFQDLEGLTEVFRRMSAGISVPKLPLWADFSFLTQSPRLKSDV